ncbi:MAG: hypothetical protein OEL83_07060 [Desulforhopalus sp.]|nr:hypothetical protein [Desulforhopalus sp.]
MKLKLYISFSTYFLIAMLIFPAPVIACMDNEGHNHEEKHLVSANKVQTKKECSFTFSASQPNRQQNEAFKKFLVTLFLLSGKKY